jgi:DNA-binding transcriptional regulator YiaG
MWTKERLKTLRDALQMTQGELADKLGCSPKTVPGWEQGRPISKPYQRILESLEAEVGKRRKTP